MKRNDVEKIYKENGLNNYKLTSLEDLIKCHGIDALNVKGYENLTKENKEIYKNFIINYFNANGIGLRMCIFPVAINYVEDIDCVANDPDEEEYVVTVIRKINAIKNDGKKKQLHQYSNKDYRNLKIIEQYRSEYLRFEFKEGKTSVWLHVTDEIKDLNTKEHKLEVDILVQGIKQPVERKEDKELLDAMYSKPKSKQDIVVFNGVKIVDEKENNIDHKEKYIGTIREQIAKIAEYDSHPTIVISDDRIKVFFYKVEQITILEKEIQAVSSGSVLNLYTRNIVEINEIPEINETLFKMSAYRINEGIYLYFENYDHEMKHLTRRGLVEINDNI